MSKSKKNKPNTKQKMYRVQHTTTVTMIIFADSQKEAEDEMRAMATYRNDNRHTNYLKALLMAEDSFTAKEIVFKDKT